MFFRNLEKYNIILGSQSPRRKELLSGVGINFTVVLKNDGNEEYPDTLEAEKIPVYLAEQKLLAYADELQINNNLVITADTIVLIQGKVLGKPVSKSDAIQILTCLSGKWHKVITGVCIACKEKKISFDATSEVHFKTLSQEEIEYYVENYKPYDKAGAYGIQEWIGYIAINEIKGSYYNVMGLPIQKLCENLKSF